MVRTKRRMGLCITLLCLNIAFIWGNSLLPGEISGAISHWLQNVLASIFGSLTPPGADEGHGLLRKLAHFTEFACLGMCLSWLVRMLREKRPEHYLYPLLGGFFVACADETIQMFVPGRGPGIKDVAIDTLGVCLGIVLIAIITTKNFGGKQNEKADFYAAGSGHGRCHGRGLRKHQRDHRRYH